MKSHVCIFQNQYKQTLFYIPSSLEYDSSATIRTDDFIGEAIKLKGVLVNTTVTCSRLVSNIEKEPAWANFSGFLDTLKKHEKEVMDGIGKFGNELMITEIKVLRGNAKHGSYKEKISQFLSNGTKIMALDATNRMVMDMKSRAETPEKTKAKTVGTKKKRER